MNGARNPISLPVSVNTPSPEDDGFSAKLRGNPPTLRMKGADDNDLGLGALSRLVKGLVAQEEDCELPEGMSAKGFLQNLVHRGALQERSDGTFHCPIPSFRTYLVEAGGLEPSPTRDEPEDDDWTPPEPTPSSDPTDPHKT